MSAAAGLFATTPAAAASGAAWLRRTAPVMESYAAIRGGVGITLRDDIATLSVTGDGATGLLDRCLAGNILRLAENRIRWTVLLDEAGRVVSDLLVWSEFSNFQVTCARPALAAVLMALRAGLATAEGEVSVEDCSDAVVAISVEGPDALEAPALLAGPDAGGLSLLGCLRCDVDGLDVVVGRHGFSGEFGYDLLCPRADVDALVERLRAVFPAAVPCDPQVHRLLRLEMRNFDLAGEPAGSCSALEAGLHWAIDFRKPHFAGRDAVFAEKAGGLRRRLVGFALGGAPANIEAGATLSDAGEAVGVVTTAAFSPTVGKVVGLAALAEAYGWVGITLDVETAGGPGRVRLVSTPFLITESMLRASR